MKISLIGMAGSGKSYWSKKLEEKGFKRFCCDDLIEKRLNGELKKLGYSGIADVSKWMGQPFEERYKKNSIKYLNFEIKVMEEIIELLENKRPNENIVIDTTGSVVYTGNKILSLLGKLTKVIYLHTPSFVIKQVLKEYIKNPKPVIWGNSFYKKSGEDNIKALERCFPMLLEFRVKKYKEISQIILDYYILRHENFDDNVFIDVLKKYD